MASDTPDHNMMWLTGAIETASRRVARAQLASTLLNRELDEFYHVGSWDNETFYRKFDPDKLRKRVDELMKAVEP